jgi:hypothetical protein
MSPARCPIRPGRNRSPSHTPRTAPRQAARPPERGCQPVRLLGNSGPHLRRSVRNAVRGRTRTPKQASPANDSGRSDDEKARAERWRFHGVLRAALWSARASPQRFPHDRTSKILDESKATTMSVTPRGPARTPLRRAQGLELVETARRRARKSRKRQLLSGSLVSRSCESEALNNGLDSPE